MIKSKLLRLSVSCLVSVCVICSNTIAETGQEAKPSCDSVLNACLDYAKILEKERDLYRDSVQLQQERIRELEKTQPSQPWYFWLVLGAASAIVIDGVRR